MRRGLRRGALLMASVALSTAVAGARSTSAVLVLNHSDYDISHLYLTYDDSDDWGDDQLGPRGLPRRTGRVRLTDVACDTYDVRLEGKDGASCEVDDIDLCGHDEVWTITNEQLRACPGWKTSPAEKRP